MILTIPDVLTLEELATLRDHMSAATFVDGRLTAGWNARLVKDNTQVDKRDPRMKEMQELVGAALKRCKLFNLAVRPKTLRPFLFSRYEPGMAYGSHVDDAVMGGMRTDVSFTLFLSDPDEYDGGELVMQTPTSEMPYRLPAGAIITYPSTFLHRVSPVTRGRRLAAVGWARSLVRDPGEREILYDLDTARQAIFNRDGKTAEFDTLSKCLANLLRRWVED
jgi:PKHD-type hydroxylase